ncbi:thiamine-phosphate synthase family protein [Haloplanus pelagicus]|jgi:predicted fused transcriptional regulator/phosphomethylpyrimidine kinase/predicted transcriptional regulator|uniref:thiamine-phosphate synthase family protein n=1 Tax=Haloplanus pelagicus TaxID=2949995 RepID=UPI00203AF875|nr:thiamine-phosphate synthase family protein [Haloplanus sp. HW8-1]
MKFIEEIVVEEFLPTVRSMLAADLRDRGFTQREVANALGISQSAVSKYAHGDVTTSDAISGDDRVQDLVERVGTGLATGDMSRVQALVEIEVAIRRLEDGDLLAERHREVMPELREHGGDFDVHDPDSAVRTTEEVRSSVRRGLRILRNTSGFAALVPNVGSNLVECLPDATDVEDVAAVPGRIFDVRGTATVPSDPEFGVSEHVASVLLSARAAGAPVRGAVNLRYDPDLIADLRAAGYRTVEFTVEREGREDGETTRAGVVDAVGDAGPDSPFVLYQTGGFGIEPITYVLGDDAPAVARIVRDHCRR